MQPAEIRTTTLNNGLVVLVQPMPDVQSASFVLMIPAGSTHEPAGCNGASSAISDLIMRGAAGKSSRELAGALDALGVQRSESVGWHFISFSGATLKGHLAAALDIYADVIQRPDLPQQELPAVIAGIEQSLLAMEDEPQRKALVELRRRCYDAPWGLPTEGSLDDLPNITHDILLDHYRRCFRPNGAVIGIAGNVNVDRVVAQIERLFGSWSPSKDLPVVRGSRGPRVDHISHDSQQTQIAMAYDAVPYSHPDYYTAWAAVSVLSGGSSSRLFTEVREKRGLCYTVYATLNSLLKEGRVLCYAGTTAERAQETLDVTLNEIEHLSDGIADDELERCTARAKSTLVMQQESTGARAGALARDWFHLGRVVPLEEIREKIDALSAEQVGDYARAHPPRDVTLLTIGPEPLKISQAPTG
mgnify:FL=1